ncbi:MAG: ATP-binding cassette domain-containing protein [Ruminococcus sp.]|nr:ATP-binding cassette domain-containing protein [Ruminococcus sp.]
MEILNVKGLNFTYPQCGNKALDDITFSVSRGEFVVLCGATGSGKTTLLRMLKRELTPLGDKEGVIEYNGKNIDELDERTSASAIGFVMQRPEQQIVTDKVWHELAFGLENLGFKREEIARRTAEVASYFGMSEWYEKNTEDLSGGQKQLLNLASILAVHPDIIILDEPTSQLDPIAASEFIAALKRLNREFSITIIISEHRLEELVPVCDRLMVMDKGKVFYFDEPKKAAPYIKELPQVQLGMPSAARIYYKLDNGSESPLTIREGKDYIESNYKTEIRSLPQRKYEHSDEKALEFKDVSFRYSRDSRDILKGLDLTVYKGELFSVLGGNGAGKTTFLKAAADLVKIYNGQIRIFGKKTKEYKNRSLYKNCLAMLPQDVQTVFLKNTVREELDDSGTDIKSLPFDLSYLLEKHPYDLSGGEQQLLALAKVLAANPHLLLLDEPTKGLDAAAKQKISGVLHDLKEKNVTVVSVTHDVEFAAMSSDRCAMFFNGRIAASGTPDEFFSENTFYTTAISRITRGVYDKIVTLEDAVEICTLNGRRTG